MSLVAGPGVGGSLAATDLNLGLVVEKHVKYIQTLDTVRSREYIDTAKY